MVRLSAGDRSLEGLALLDIEVIVSIEDDLFPVGGLVIGASGELDFIGEFIEVDIEPSDDTVNSVTAEEIELIGGSEVEVLFLDSVEVDFHDFAVRRVDGVFLADINNRLGHHGGLDALHVDVVDFVPEAEFLSLVVAVFHGSDGQSGFVREDLTYKKKYF